MILVSLSKARCFPLRVLSLRNDLGSAHRGYIYQDISTAYFMAECLANQTGLLTVDRKICSDDRFDDLSVKTSSGLVRRQFKRSDDPARPLKREDLATTNYSLRIDHLIQTFLAAGSDCGRGVPTLRNLGNSNRPGCAGYSPTI